MTGLPVSNGKLLRFGVFELDAASGRLCKNGMHVRLQDQPTRVLLHLLQHRGAVVTREELQSALWSGDTFVDFDHGLNTAVNKIRDALGDSASSPRFIETLPRKGYRFIAPVEEVRPAPLVSRPPSWVWAAAGLLLALTLTAGWFLIATRGDAQQPLVTPLTSLPGFEWGPSFSPDGDRVAFCWNGPAGDNYDIYVKQIGSEQMLRITTDPAVDVGPAWSPDGLRIAFARVVSENRRELIVVPSMGGPERKITEFHSFEAPKTRAASWGPDGRWMMITDFAGSAKSTYSLHWISVETGERRQLTFPPEDVIGDRDPAVSPDGRHVAFVRRLRGQQSHLLLLRMIGGNLAPEPPVQLVPDSHFSGPAWTPDGTELIFPFGRLHLPHLARLRIGETRLSRLEFAGERTWAPAVSLRGGRLSFVRFVSDVNIWRHIIGRSGPGATVRWPGSSTYLDHVPRYSPDGRRIAFISNRNGMQSLWVCEADGSNAVRLSDLKDEEIAGLYWTPDGNRIVAAGGSKGYVFDARSGAMQPAPEAGPVSRDGRWLYFDSKKTGRNEIWKMPFDGGAAVQVTRQGGRLGIESVDGRLLYYVKVDGGTSLWRVPVGGGNEQRVLEALMNPLSFDVTEEGIYFIPPARPERRREIQFLRFASGTVETVTELDKEPATGLTWGLSVSPDRRSILFTQLDQYNSDLMLVDNFR